MPACHDFARSNFLCRPTTLSRSNFNCRPITLLRSKFCRRHATFSRSSFPAGLPRLCVLIFAAGVPAKLSCSNFCCRPAMLSHSNFCRRPPKLSCLILATGLPRSRVNTCAADFATILHRCPPLLRFYLVVVSLPLGRTSCWATRDHRPDAALVKILRHRIPLPLRYQIATPIIHCSHYLFAPEATVVII